VLLHTESDHYPSLFRNISMRISGKQFLGSCNAHVNYLTDNPINRVDDAFDTVDTEADGDVTKN
jgi:hypothetical protein